MQNRYSECAMNELPSRFINQEISFHHPQSIITLHPFTITTSGVTNAITNHGNRPCVGVTGAGNAGDLTNACMGVAGILLQAGIPTTFQFGFHCDGTEHIIEAGLSVVGTGLVASPATNYIKFKKAASDWVPKICLRKASGTEVSIPLAITLAADTWYDFSVEITPSSTAGMGRLRVAYSSGNTRPKTMTIIYDDNVGSQVPDTVAMAGYWAVSTPSVSTASYFSHYNLFM